MLRSRTAFPIESEDANSVIIRDVLGATNKGGCAKFEEDGVRAAREDSGTVAKDGMDVGLQLTLNKGKVWTGSLEKEVGSLGTFGLIWSLGLLLWRVLLFLFGLVVLAVAE